MEKIHPFPHSLSIWEGKKQGESQGAPGRGPKHPLARCPILSSPLVCQRWLPALLQSPAQPAALTLNMSLQLLVLPESSVSGRAKPALLMQMSTPLC